MWQLILLLPPEASFLLSLHFPPLSRKIRLLRLSRGPLIILILPRVQLIIFI